jgi:hypothetical protein
VKPHHRFTPLRTDGGGRTRRRRALDPAASPNDRAAARRGSTAHFASVLVAQRHGVTGRPTPIEIVQRPVPEQSATFQPTKTEPLAAFAVRRTSPPAARLARRELPHSIPEGELVTTPPQPARDGECRGGRWQCLTASRQQNLERFCPCRAALRTARTADATVPTLDAVATLIIVVSMRSEVAL